MLVSLRLFCGSHVKSPGALHLFDKSEYRIGIAREYSINVLSAARREVPTARDNWDRSVVDLSMFVVRWRQRRHVKYHGAVITQRCASSPGIARISFHDRVSEIDF